MIESVNNEHRKLRETSALGEQEIESATVQLRMLETERNTAQSQLDAANEKLAKLENSITDLI
jgi:chromosome segregation ATPase